MRSHGKQRLISCVVLCVALSFGGSVALAQIPDEFTNLQVLPKDMGKRDLVSIMRNFAGALGVRCGHCHVGEGDSLDSYDFASDDIKAKDIARGMMKMTSEINDRLLPGAGIKSHGVRCVTCHGGVTHPEGLDEILLEVIEEDGVEAAQKRYRQLREEYYGSGAYDFSAPTLNAVAETLAEKQDLQGAIAMLELNVEMGDTAHSRMMLGQLHAMSGDTEKARASVERALELEPDNPRAKQMLERLTPQE